MSRYCSKCGKKLTKYDWFTVDILGPQGFVVSKENDRVVSCDFDLCMSCAAKVINFIKRRENND